MNKTPSELVICVETCFKEIILDSTVYSTTGLLHILLTICRRLEYLGSQTCTLINPQEFRLKTRIQSHTVFLFSGVSSGRALKPGQFFFLFVCSHMIYDAEFKIW